MLNVGQAAAPYAASTGLLSDGPPRTARTPKPGPSIASPLAPQAWMLGLDEKDLVSGPKPDDLELVECHEDWSHTGTPQWACSEDNPRAGDSSEAPPHGWSKCPRSQLPMRPRTLSGGPPERPKLEARLRALGRLRAQEEEPEEREGLRRERA